MMKQNSINLKSSFFINNCINSKFIYKKKINNIIIRNCNNLIIICCGIISGIEFINSTNIKFYNCTDNNLIIHLYKSSHNIFYQFKYDDKLKEFYNFPMQIFKNNVSFNNKIIEYNLNKNIKIHVNNVVINDYFNIDMNNIFYL